MILNLLSIDLPYTLTIWECILELHALGLVTVNSLKLPLKSENDR